MNKIRKCVDAIKILNHSDFCKKIQVYMSTKTAGGYYDSYEQNYTRTNLNPITIKGYVSILSASSLVWNQYGLREQGAVQILVEDKYRTMLENCNKITIDNEEYEVYREATGSRTLITSLPKKMLRVILTRTGKS
jgi:hypothetical protein